MTAELDAVDHETLQRAFAMACAQSPEERARFEKKLRKEGWEKAHLAAAYACQCRSLKPKPWEAPPMDSQNEVDPSGGYGRTEAEVGLRLRLLEANLSVYEPDPEAALAAAEAKRRDVA